MNMHYGMLVSRQNIRLELRFLISEISIYSTLNLTSLLEELLKQKKDQLDPSRT